MRTRLPLQYLALGAWAVILTGGTVLWSLPIWVAGLYLALSFVTYAVYAHDKSVAGTRRRRVPERTLHMLDLAGGWPGGLVAQQHLRHKTRKTGYLAIFWVTVVVNLGLLVVGVWLSQDSIR